MSVMEDQYLTVTSDCDFDCGECYCASMLSFPRIRMLMSNSYEDSALIVKRSFFDETFANIPVHVKLLDTTMLDDAILSDDIKLFVPACSSVTVDCLLIPAFSSDSILLQNSSYLKVNASFNIPFEVQISQEELYNSSLKINYSVTLCASILFVEQDSITFDNCQVNHTSSRDFQIWNRSECVLEYQLSEFTLMHNDLAAQLQDVANIRAEDGETGSIISISEVVKIAPFASQRVKMFFEPLAQGLFVVNCALFNKHNGGNTVNLSMKANVKEITANLPKKCPIELFEDDSDLNVLIANREGSDDFFMDFGDCYTGVRKIKRCWLRNITQRNIEVCMVIPTDQNIVHDGPFFSSKEVIFDNSAHIPDEIYSYEAYRDKYTSMPAKLCIDEANDAVEVSQNISSVDNVKSLENNREETSTVTRARDTSNSEPLKEVEKENVKGNAAGVLLKETSKPSVNVVVDAPFDKISLWGSKMGKSSQTVSSTPRVSGSKPGGTKQSRGNENNLVCGRMWGDVCLLSTVDGEEEGTINLKECLPQVVFGGLHSLENDPVGNSRPFIGRVFKNYKNKQYKANRKPTVIVEQSVTALDTKPDVISVNIEPGPASLEDPGTFNFSSFSGAFSPELSNETKAAPLINSVAETPEHYNFVSSVKFVLKPQEMSPCSVVVTPSANYTDASGVAVGSSLMTRSIRAVISIRFMDESDGNSPKPTSVTDDESILKSLDLNLKLRTCNSMVSVSQLVYDLGLCSVGEFRSVVVNVSNDCDLPASIYSFVQSETLSIVDPELLIPARSSKLLKVEYVAHEENSLYTKQAMLVNIHNPNNNIQIEVRAKNVDTQQVLLHSLFYKLITFNNRRQLQVLFEKSLINMPNLKTFCIKNTHHRMLRIEIIVERGKCLQIFLVKSAEEMKTIATENKLISAVKSVPSSSVASSKSTKYTKVNDFEMEDFINNPTESEAVEKVPETVNTNVTTNSTEMNQHIEDLKWGSNTEENSNRMLLFTKSATLRISSAIDNEFHMTKGEKMSLMNQIPISSDLNALDVNMPSTNTVGGHKLMSSLDLSGYNRSGDIFSTNDNKDISQTSGIPTVKSTIQKDIVDSAQMSTRNLNLISDLDKEIFPHSIIEKYSSSELEEIDFTKSISSKVPAPSKSVPSSKNEIEHNVRLLQKTYGEFKALMDSKGQPNSCIVPLQEVLPLEELAVSPCSDYSPPPVVSTGLRTFFVDIPPESMFTFAVILFPRSKGENLEESNKISINENIQFRLPHITVSDIESALQSSYNDHDNVTGTISSLLGSVSEGVSEQGSFPLKPRSMLIRAKATLSEMIAIQKNISFGRTLVGDKTSRVVTLINRSSIPCLFSVSKSGSISSGFLQIPEGRKGVIPAYSTKHLEFVFKPTLSGSFEETIHIDNVLNPKNTQSIIIKAKVSKTESFSLNSHVVNPITKVDSKSNFPTSEDSSSVANAQMLSDISAKTMPSTVEKLDSTTYYKTSLERYLTDNLSVSTSSGPNFLVSSSAIAVVPNVAASSTVIPKSSIPPVFMGNVAVGEQCEVIIQFRIKNLTSKKRQFIVDATHSNAVVLLASSVLSGREKHTEIVNASRSPGRKAYRHRSKSLAHLQETENPFVLPFEPIPEILQSVISMKCKFSAVHWSQEKGTKAGKSESSLSEEERLVLEDSLEKFQQKLKIAIRKNKPEKIEKYQKKINKVIGCLTGGKEGSIANDDKDSLLKEAKKNAEKDGDEDEQPTKHEEVIPSVTPAIVEESEVAIFYLDPDQEKVISVKVSFLPGTSYATWAGVLPFAGHLRVFECRNEDLVKTIHFGALVYSSRVAYSATLEKKIDGEEVEEDSFDVDKVLDASLGSFSRKSSGGKNDRLSISSLVELQKVENSFLVTVAQWSAFPTKHIYPKYRQLPENVLGMSVKLVHASKDRVMYGALSIASVLLTREATFAMTVDDTFNVKSSSDYVTYNSKIHGAISFGLISSSNHSIAYESHLSYASINKDETVQYSESSTQSTIDVGGKLLFILKWRPPAEELKSDVNLLGAFKIQCKVKDQIVGAEQFVPFVCVGQHKSIFKVDRSYSFGDVSMGSYRMANIPITNTSDSEDLNYVVTSEEVALSSSAVGKVQLNNGQTGVIPPNGSKILQLLFSATAAGKFEQKLWIRNVGDGFDQKRIVIQANVILTQAKFVTFPDLEHSLDSNEGKYKTIDLGQIQIQSIVDSALVSQHPAFQQELTPHSVFRLRIENVSDQVLNVTAISNLKSQCFIYSDEACTQLAINSPMAKSEVTTLYVQIRPVYLQVKSGEWLPTSKSSGSLSSLGSKSGVSEATVDSKSKFMGRELKGGIRLIFFAIDAVLPTKVDAGVMDNAPVDFIQRKLFETALSFKAIVGQSRLKVKSQTPSLRYVPVSMPSFLSVSCGDSVCRNVHGKFEIKNDSTFNARYSYLMDASRCVGRNDDQSHADLLDAKTTSLSKLQLKIADDFIGELKPGETRTIEYCVQYSFENEMQLPNGLVIHNLQVVNLSTKDVSNLKIGIFFDCGQVREINSKPNSPTTSVKEEFNVLSSDVPIWLTGLDSKMRNKRLKKLRAGEQQDEYFTSDIENESVISDNNNNNSNMLWYEITGATNRVLGSCVISNDHSLNPLTLTPVSDVPVIISIEHTGGRSSKLNDRGNKTSKHVRKLSTDSIPQPAGIYGRWKRIINKVGDPFTIPPLSSVTVVMCAQSGHLLDEEIIDELHRSKLESGNQCKLGGIVAFVQAAHALQSLFEPTLLSPNMALSPSPGLRNDDNIDTPTKTSIFPQLPSVIPERQQFETLPFVYLMKVNCSFVVPKLSIPLNVYTLGKLRSGYRATFEIVVENSSEVDIPCSLSGLPSWLTLHPDNFEGGSFEETALDDLGEYDLDVNGESPFTKNISNREPATNFTAKKLQLWLENKNINSVEEGDLITANEKGEKLVGDLNDITLEKHQLRFSAAEDDYCVAPNPQGVSADNLEQFNEDFENDNEVDFDDDARASLDFAVSLPMDLDSMMVHRQSEVLRKFTAPKASKMTIKLVVQAPFIESQRLEHKIRIKNLTSTSDTGLSDFELLVLLDVDSAKAIEIMPGANDPLVVVASRPVNQEFIQPLSSPSMESVTEGMYPSPYKMAPSAQVGVTMGSACYRLIREPLVVPPPVVSTFTDDIEVIRCDSVIPVDETTTTDGRSSTVPSQSMPSTIKATHKLSSEAKLSVSFFLTNHISKTVKINTTFSINPVVAQVLDIQFKFHQNNDSNIVMMAKETVEAKVSINSKIGSRFEDIGAYLGVYPVKETDLVNDEKNQQPQTSVRKDEMSPLVIQLPTADNSINNESNLRKATVTNAAAAKNSVGPILFGTLCFRPAVQSEKQKRDRSVSFDYTVPGGDIPFNLIPIEENVGDSNFVAPQDVIFVDVVGYLTAGPTVSITKLMRQPTNSVALTNPSPNMLDSQQAPVPLVPVPVVSANSDLAHLLIFRITEETTDVSSVTQSKVLRLNDEEQSFYLSNPSNILPLNFSIKSGSYRCAGMKLLLPSKWSDSVIDKLDGYYDTVTVKATPSRGAIAPGGSLVVTVNVLPGNPADAIKAASTIATVSDLPDKTIRAIARGDKLKGEISDTRSVLACIPVLIVDNDWPLHPPRKVSTYLVSDKSISTFLSLPVSETKYSGGTQNSDDPSPTSEVSELTERERKMTIVQSSKDNVNTSFSPELFSTVNNINANMMSCFRLRGVTPLNANSPGRFIIDLKQQTQRKEAIEWLVSIELIGSNTVPFSVNVVSSAELGSWLTVGQNKGVASSGSSSSVMLYFSRSNVGVFSGYIVIQNKLLKSNDQVIFVTMEVVAADNRKGNVKQPTIAASPVATITTPTVQSSEDASTSVAQPPPVVVPKPAKVKVPLFFTVDVTTTLQPFVTQPLVEGESEVEAFAASELHYTVTEPEGSVFFALQNVTDLPLDLTVSLKAVNSVFQLLCDNATDDLSDTLLLVTVAPKETSIVNCRFVLGNESNIEEAELVITARLFEDHAKSLKLFVHCK